MAEGLFSGTFVLSISFVPSSCEMRVSTKGEQIMFLAFNSMHIQWKSNQPEKKKKEKNLRCYYFPEHGETLVL